MKHLKKFNEGFINRIFNKDEKEAENIYKRIDSLTKEDISYDYDTVIFEVYSFEISGFNIDVSSNFEFSGKEYKLSVEGIKMKASNLICKKIFKKVEKIYNYKDTSVEDEETEFLKKDIKTEFRR